ncbi:MAG TPA: TIGR02391 family protein [Puia sp.]|uniref:TIGR02391 family protein n=1 Tax=Puia sp. TaxID=2045100 RepID=UPI002D1D898C|nr:TIGR02391 family protein [Puia sp.]HVU96867.1 TIGR02391 family protein [Puia sp.]
MNQQGGISVIQSFYLEGICKLIAETYNGLTGSEIAKILADCQVPDTDPTITKWKRLYNAFTNFQNANQDGTKVVVFLCRAMHPSRFVGQMERYQFLLNELNKRLSFVGIELTDTGKFRRVANATTLSEADQRASHFKAKLEARRVHAEVIKFCNAELLVENYFHSLFEGVKSIAERLRFMFNVLADGNALGDVAFSTNNPLIRINLLSDDTQRSEHLGLANMIKGLFGLIRNPTAHTPKIKFVIEEEEAMGIMTIISLVHKPLDRAL